MEGQYMGFKIIDLSNFLFKVVQVMLYDNKYFTKNNYRIACFQRTS